MIKLNLGIGLPNSLPKGNIKCPVFMIAKGTRTNTLLPTFRPLGVLDIISCDLMGPFEIPTFSDGKYILAIHNIATSYSEIKILAKKSKASQLLIDQVPHFKTATGKQVKCIRSDNTLVILPTS